MVDNMKKMIRWHLEEFDTNPIGDGYEVDVTEFEFRDEKHCHDGPGRSK